MKQERKIKTFIIENAFLNAGHIALLNIRKFQIQVGAVHSSGFIEISALDRLDKIILFLWFPSLRKEFDISVSAGTVKKKKLIF